MSRIAVELLEHELRDAYDSVRSRIEGLTDEEYFWEPVAGCWTVRADASGKWSADYPGGAHPEPPPFTTIAWRLVHLGECKLMYHEYAFGDGKLTWAQIDSAHTARSAIAQLEEGQALLVADLARLEDEDLDRSVLTNWGERWPSWRVFWTMISHDLHHGGEVGALRDLYRARPIAAR